MTFATMWKKNKRYHDMPSEINHIQKKNIVCSYVQSIFLIRQIYRIQTKVVYEIGVGDGYTYIRGPKATTIG